MSLFTRSLWPERVSRPYLRLALAMLLAPAILALAGTAISFAIAGFSETTRTGVMAVTTDAGIVLGVFAALLTILAGLPGVATLWALGKRGVIAWAAAGAAFGAVAAVILGLLQQGRTAPLGIAVGAIFCCLMFLLVRALAGVRIR